MWPFDQIARVALDAAQKVVEVVVDTAKAVGDVVTDVAETVGGVIRGGADMAGSFLKGGLDLARGWVNANLGDSWLGAIARGGIDLVRAGVGLVEFGLEVTGSLVTFTGQVLGDLLRGDPGAIPGRTEELWNTISDDAQDLNRDAGIWVIDESQIGRPIAGAPRTKASAWSVAASLDIGDFGTPDPRTYKDTGKRYEFELRAGEVFFRECTMTTAEPPWNKLVFRTEDEKGSMIGFDRRRLGDLIFDQGRAPPAVDGPILPVPLFDSICANADRVFAKEAGTDNFYFLLMDELFWGPETLDADDPYESKMLRMPSNYFKVDPQQNRSGARVEDLAAGLVGEPLPKIPQSERHILFEEALKLGLLGTVVRVQPRLWYRIDCRPPLDNSEDPISILPPFAPRTGIPIPHYDHVTRRSDTFYGGLQPPLIGKSIDFDQVLDIGVGNSHFHEPWTAIYGGELRNTRVEYFHGIALGELTYSMLNGPLSDGDHYADGTCNFYILARLRGSQNYVVLYCDEQTFFTQRWRLAAPADNTPTDITKLNFSVAAALAETRDEAMFAFEPDRFWTPFGRRYLDATSRMAVSRTVVVVNGSDPRTGHAELYSANVGYGVFDRTWRYRDLNAAGFVVAPALGPEADASLPVPALATKTRRGDVVQGVAPRTVWPQTVRLREDMHLVLTGTAAGSSPEAVVAGVWTQTYLPADGEVHPSKEGHAEGRTVRAGTRAPKPATGFAHPWTFWSDSVFALADRFSHLGVYSQVNARTQFYALDILDNTVLDEQCSGWRFVDEQRGKGPKPGQLYIKAIKLHWQNVGRRLRSLLGLGGRLSLLQSLASNAEVIRSVAVTVFEELGREDIIRWETPPRDAAEANEQLRASRRSMYLRDGMFDLRQAGDLGAIATWHDKRDDDLIALSDLPMETTLISASDPDVSIRVRFRQRQIITQPPIVQWAKVALVEQLREGLPDHAVEIRYRTNRTSHQLALQLYSFNLAALDRAAQDNPALHLLYGEHHRDTRPVEGSPGEWVALIQVNAAWVARNARYLGPEGRLDHGTSLWFTGPTGLVATPEATEFA